MWKKIGLTALAILVAGLLAGLSGWVSRARAAEDIPIPVTARWGLYGVGWCARYLQEKRMADALGITVEQYRAAQMEAAKAALQQALNQGRITEQQYQDRLAWLQVKYNYLQPEQLIAQALGIQVEDVYTACETGQTLQDLLSQHGLDILTFRQKLEDAATQQVLKALQDGVVTQEQLARVASWGMGLGKFGKGPRLGRGWGRWYGPGFIPQPQSTPTP